MNWIIISAAIVIIVMVLLYRIAQNTEEPFTAGDLNKITKSVDDIGKMAEKIPKELKELNDKMADVKDEAVQQMNDIIVTKFESVFIQIGDIFDDGLINPIMALMEGLGNMFVQIFKIFEEIGNKIISLPGCIILYMIVETLNIIVFFYRLIIPSIIRGAFFTLYKYTFKVIVDFILRFIGYTGAVSSCYSFNVNKQIKSMEKGFSKVNSEFKNNFGRLDFSKISV